MTTNEITNNTQPKNSLTSLFFISLWLIALLILTPMMLSIFFDAYFGIQQGDNYSPDAFYDWVNSIPVLLKLSLMASLINIYILVKATHENNWTKRLDYWAVHSVNRQELVKWLAVVLIFLCVSTLLGVVLNLPIENFMLDVQAANDSLAMLLLIIVTVSIVIPIMEELIFRGWLYSKIKQTNLGDIGALVITTFVFTAIHAQYDNLNTLIYIFSLGLLLGFIRYKTDNTSNTVVIHIFLNSLVLIELFYF
ncbi:CPBP family intramembrane metalloprotease [Thalassotalea sp. 1_MG-2023]|uniref:CPBP family intramembrane glutamic endopeptidase n=1 Tax=Thalassotalea sp. 1_MG-2023 TaxID=3062680 RepID=UPI0026E467B3|nr:CPBP family intramembrane glutamic endopeptidase [Thalassotalea sp. 1_MG-2023]MDO6426404.1 CPBP family intramembrane metalloprotease [Thalassotalea sp. 1_MG-2023]